jgi:hypothetical protein
VQKRCVMLYRNEWLEKAEQVSLTMVSVSAI